MDGGDGGWDSGEHDHNGDADDHHKDGNHQQDHHGKNPHHDKNPHVDKPQPNDGKKILEKIDKVLESEEKNGFFRKIYNKGKKNFIESTPNMKIVKGTALVGSAILAVNGVINLVSIHSNKNSEDADKKKKSLIEVVKIGAAAAVTYFSVLRGGKPEVSLK